MRPSVWTPERLAVLRGLVEQKLSGSQVASKLGLSRQAVIMAVDRAHKADPDFPRLQGGKGGGSRKQAGQAASHSPARNSSLAPGDILRRATGASPASRPSFGPLPAGGAPMDGGAIAAVKPKGQLADAVGVEPPPSALILMQLEARHCRWPMPGPSGAAQLFCGCQRVEGRPYCAEHVLRARGAGTEGERSADRIGRAA